MWRRSLLARKYRRGAGVWSYRSLTAIPWLVEHGFGPVETYPETGVLLAAMH